MAYRRNPAIGGRGMGDAPCPSLQQLQGISDPSDPCQGYQDLPLSQPGLCYDKSASVVPCPAAGQVTTLLPSALGPYTAPGVSSFTSMFAQLQSLISQNPLTAIAIGGGVLLLFMAAGGRRR